MNKQNGREPDAVTERWDRMIAPHLASVKKRGFVAQVVRELERLAPGRTWHRQQVDRWMSPDQEKRIQPLAGVGLLLIDALVAAEAALAKEGKTP